MPNQHQPKSQHIKHSKPSPKKPRRYFHTFEELVAFRKRRAESIETAVGGLVTVLPLVKKHHGPEILQTIESTKRAIITSIIDLARHGELNAADRLIAKILIQSIRTGDVIRMRDISHRLTCHWKNPDESTWHQKPS